MKPDKKTCSTCVYFAVQKEPRGGWGSVMSSGPAFALGMGVCSCPYPSTDPRPATNLMHPEDSCEHHQSAGMFPE